MASILKSFWYHFIFKLFVIALRSLGDYCLPLLPKLVWCSLGDLWYTSKKESAICRKVQGKRWNHRRLAKPSKSNCLLRNTTKTNCCADLDSQVSILGTRQLQKTSQTQKKRPPPRLRLMPWAIFQGRATTNDREKQQSPKQSKAILNYQKTITKFKKH